jgi:hypothetical protein
MRIERQNSGFPAVIARDRDHSIEDLAMANVNPVKIADGDGARPEAALRFS